MNWISVNYHKKIKLKNINACSYSVFGFCLHTKCYRVKIGYRSRDQGLCNSRWSNQCLKYKWSFYAIDYHVTKDFFFFFFLYWITVGGLLNATCGNVTELIIAIFALSNNNIAVVKYSLLGSIISNLLLVLGTSLFCGGLANLRQEQRYDRVRPCKNPF